MQLHNASWWAQLEDRLYYAPASASPQLNISHFYYGLGHRAALTDELEAHRVGGGGRWHIFHLPQGVSMLQTASLGSNGDRRKSLSQLRHLQHELALEGAFPLYDLAPDYENPLSSFGQAQEKVAVSMVDSSTVEAFMRDIVELPKTGGVHTRSWENPTATEAAQRYLAEQFRLMGLSHVCLHNFSYSGTEQSNVVAFVPGGDAGDAVVVGAHYDSRPFEGEAPGAVDNGSGLALLLTAAKAFAQSNTTPVKSLYFVAFAAEEAGLRGSDAFAAELSASGGAGLPQECRRGGGGGGGFLRAGRSTAAPSFSAIVVDEVGWLSPSLDKPTVNLESYDWEAGTGLPAVLEHMAQSSQLHNGDALEITHSSHPFGSDHMSFLDRGIPAVLAINADDEDYPNYHQSTDTLSNVNLELVALIGKMVLGATMRLAGTVGSLVS